MVLTEQVTRRPRLEVIAGILFIFLFVAIVLKNAWVSEDAYITYRTVDNFINGYGLTWNVDERVQVYTHPLWMLLVSAVYLFTREMFYTPLFLSLAISTAVVLLVVFGLARSVTAAGLGVTILVFSKAFIDYSTSGLENPVTHLALVGFLLVYLKGRLNFRTLLLLALIAALGTVNRMDTLLLFLPGLGYMLFKFRRLKGLYAVLLGFLPFVLWAGFAVFYYGFLFPNTAYAKLNTGLQESTLLRMGLYYFLDSLRIDPLTLLVITAGMIAVFAARAWEKIPVVVGLALYLLYTLTIGGDYMSGRYFSGPFLVAAVLLVDSPFISLNLVRWPLLAAVLVVGLSSTYPPLFSGADYPDNDHRITPKVLDERRHHHDYTSLVNFDQAKVLNHRWTREGLSARERGVPVYVGEAVGLAGFYAGPTVHIIDRYALGDPLLARLPPILDTQWLSGHFRRRIPDGYYETVLLKQNLIVDKNLAAYYDRLALVTRGELFDLNRLKEIWNLNTGRYDSLLKAYPHMWLVSAAGTDPAGTRLSWQGAEGLEQYAGIQVNLGQVYHHARLEIGLSRNSDYRAEDISDDKTSYRIIYFAGDEAVAVQNFKVPVISQDSYTLVADIPAEAAGPGYDGVKIFPASGDHLYTAIRTISYIKFLE